MNGDMYKIRREKLKMKSNQVLKDFREKSLKIMLFISNFKNNPYIGRK